MIRILFTTLLADLIGCVISFITLLFIENGEDINFLYIGLFLFGNLFFPTLIGVLVYQLLKFKLPFINSPQKFIQHILSLILVFTIALTAWTIFDVIDDFTFENLKDDFKNQFLGFVPAALSIAIAIPILEVIFNSERLSR